MRSNFLVHWTGKDLFTTKMPSDLASIEASVQNQFVDRLASIVTDGLWMTTPLESFRGAGTSRVKYEVPLVCFTEVRLSQAYEHSQRYGLLGVVVDRKFVLDRYGLPVFYVRNHENERAVARVADVWEGILGPPANGPRYDPKVAFNYIVSFMKNMSSENADDFHFLDEHEWRIVANHELAAAGLIRETGLARPPFKVPLRPSDVRMIVFPSAATREMAMRDDRLHAFFQVLPVLPVFLTVDECRHL